MRANSLLLITVFFLKLFREHCTNLLLKPLKAVCIPSLSPMLAASPLGPDGVVNMVFSIPGCCLMGVLPQNARNKRVFPLLAHHKMYVGMSLQIYTLYLYI